MTGPRIGSLFSGYGGLDLGVQAALDGSVAWHVENADAPSAILAHHSPTIPNHGDITSVPWSEVEPVDILTGGFPCQDVSSAGLKRGLRPGTRSGLWSHFAAAIAELRPSLVIIENVRGLLNADAHSDLEPCPWCLGNDGSERHLRALGAVLGDLADIGFDARWCGLRAADAGAPHERFRVFLVAYSDGERGRQSVEPDGRGGEVGDWKTGLLDERPARHRATPDADGLDGSGSRPTRRMVGEPTDRAIGVEWGRRRAAIERWERIVGRAAPAPRVDGRTNARFVEWMMGLDDGYVTSPDIGLSHNQRMTALGNGVVPQQAELAIRHLLG